MALIKIIADIDVDPSRTDPLHVAEAFGMDDEPVYHQVAGQDVIVTLVSAEWEETDG